MKNQEQIEKRIKKLIRRIESLEKEDLLYNDDRLADKIIYLEGKVNDLCWVLGKEEIY
jgi:uncharacterized protein with PhoU and TrkA domain